MPISWWRQAAFPTVTPTGSYVEQTLLARLMERLDNPN